MLRILATAILLALGVLILPAFATPSLAAPLHQTTQPPQNEDEFQDDRPVSPPPAIQTQPQRQSYAIGWGALALINAGIAQGKNRGGLNWFLLSLPLGPIATFVLVAFFPKLQPGAGIPQ